MKIMGTGIDYSTGGLLVKPIDSKAFVEKIQESLERRNYEVQAKNFRKCQEFTGEITREIIDYGDPKKVGWTYIVNEKDPQKEEISKILKPLAEYRGMKDPESPLIFSGESEENWQEWLDNKCNSIDSTENPYYVTIVGGPDKFPFRLQSLLAIGSAVGRLDFDSLDDLKTYVDKVLRLEKAPEPAVDHKVLIFATDEGSDDPTYSSHHYMAEPLAEYIRDKAQFQTTTIMGDTATKTELTAALMNNKPAIVYTAGHGLAAPNQPLDVQMKVNGAICCQSENESIEKWCFTGDDVPLDRPFLEGSAFFQFACFGYGTPAESDFSPWVDKTLKFEKDFVAALPKKLLSHPNGPIAFVGHLDTAFLCGFDNDPTIPIGSFGTRMEPFLSAVQKLLKSVPVGLAMLHMNRRYSELSIELSNFYNEVQANKKSIDSSQDWLANTFMYREDAQNYLVLGDPAARICIPSES